MDTNTLNLKFKLEKIELEILEKLTGILGENEIQESIEVLTTKGLVKIPSNNKIDLKTYWINETCFLKNNILKITVSYPKFFNTDNSYIIKTQGEIKTVQKELIKLLENIFNLKVDDKNSIHSRIDYPINLEIKDKFKDWGKIFVLIGQATRYNENTSIYQGIDQEKNIYSKGIKLELSEDLEVNFYNQRENLKLKKKRDTGKEILRIETKLKRDFIIQRYLGTNKIKEVTLKAIKETSKEIIKKNILENLKGELLRQKEYLKSELEKYLNQKERQDQNKLGLFTLQYQSKIIDFEMIELVILSLELPKQTKTKYIEQARRELETLENIDINYKYFGNFERINFLHYKILGREYEKFNIKSQIKEV